jgi:hypothetical protein
MNDTLDKKSIFYMTTFIWYQTMLAAGVIFVTFALYRIAGGTFEAVLMLLPGIISLVGGMVIRNGFKKNFA